MSGVTTPYYKSELYCLFILGAISLIYCYGIYINTRIINDYVAILARILFALTVVLINLSPLFELKEFYYQNKVLFNLTSEDSWYYTFSIVVNIARIFIKTGGSLILAGIL